jgi:hypothetical protein
VTSAPGPPTARTAPATGPRRPTGAGEAEGAGPRPGTATGTEPPAGAEAASGETAASGTGVVMTVLRPGCALAGSEPGAHYGGLPGMHASHEVTPLDARRPTVGDISRTVGQ